MMRLEGTTGLDIIQNIGEIHQDIQMRGYCIGLIEVTESVPEEASNGQKY